ncbi:MAG: DUF3153 domain-containing protein [Gemmatimonadaceae bacterium]|nr:DUF3153 domain-containing protein [Gloeobacterales cyanobacterium ES-bin-141]
MKTLRTVALGVLTCLFLTGCASYRLGVEFDWLGGGTVRQTLNLDPLLIQMGGETLEKLFDKLTRRVEALGGRSTRETNQLQLDLPFENGRDLEGKVNVLLGQPLLADGRGLPTKPITSSPVLRLETSEYFLWTTYQFNAELDLQSAVLPLGAWTPGLPQLEFALTTPLPALKSNSDEQSVNTLIWRIRPGQTNRLEATFVVLNLPVSLSLVAATVALGWMVWRRQRVLP